MDLWNSKDIVNLWTVLHVCFGLLVASLTSLAGMELVLSLSLASAVAVIWEVYERLHGTSESVLNSIFDILSTVIACYLAFYLIKHFSKSVYVPYVLIAVSVVVYVIYFVKGKIIL
jgi:hypothetical protein